MLVEVDVSLREEDAMRISSPEETHRVFAEAANAGAVEDVVALYEPDAMVVERDGQLTIGTSAIRDHVTHLLELKPKMRIDASLAFAN
jgi:ketosteroid isomerase-like protein